MLLLIYLLLGLSSANTYEFSFEVHSVANCPISKEAWEQASVRLNCTQRHGYHCVPDKYFTSLIEFCYPRGSRIAFEKGNCLELAADGILNHVPCTGFDSGCPDQHYFSNEIYKYPKCLSINTDFNCFDADVPCILSKALVGSDRMLPPPNIESNLIPGVSRDSNYEEAELSSQEDLLKEEDPNFSSLKDICREGKEREFHLTDPNLFDENLLNKTDNMGWTLLHHAAYGGKFRIFHNLMSYKCIKLRTIDIIGRTVLHTSAAATKGEENMDIFRAIVEKDKDLLEVKYKNGLMPFCYAALAGNKSILEWISERGFDIKKQTKYGENVAHLACIGNSLEKGNQESLKTTKDEEKIISTKNKMDWNPLQYAAKTGNKKILQFLYEENVRVFYTTEDLKYPFHIACENGNLEACKYIAVKSKESIHARNTTAMHAGHFAAKSGNIEILKYLENQGLKADEVSSQNINILHIACRYERFAMCEYIAEKYPELVTQESKKGWNLALFLGEKGGAEGERIQRARGQKVEEQITNALSKSDPEEVVKGASCIVGAEARALCKRNSGSQLQQKDYTDFMSFSWDKLNQEIQVRAPYTLQIISAIISDIPKQVNSSPIHTLCTVAFALHSRSPQLSFLQYAAGFILTHGGCTNRYVERLCHLGLCVSSSSIQRELTSWHEYIDKELIEVKNAWMSGENYKRYQLVGDNWDKDIVPSYRTTERGTVSLHLFNVIAVVDRVPVQRDESVDDQRVNLEPELYLPTIPEQRILEDELVFLFATSVIHNIPVMEQFEAIYPTHIEHPYSAYAGVKTKQYALGLYDCDKKKTTDMIQLLQSLQNKYALSNDDGSFKEPVFFGGDRLTDERVQCAQAAMGNGQTPSDRLEGFISKIEDFHRLMNFLEAIHKQTYSTNSAADRGTLHYYRNLTNARGAKGKMKNAYRDYKMLYYAVLDAICCLIFLKESGMNDIEGDFLFPDDFPNFSSNDKILWLNDLIRPFIQKYFFDGKTDIFESMRQTVGDPTHPENYWISNLNDSRLKCHHCDKTYAQAGSLQVHEKKIHKVDIPKPKKKKYVPEDELFEYILGVFKLVLLHRNLDTAVDMADGPRSVRSASYELPLYNKTNKIKYLIGSIHLAALTKVGTLPCELRETLIANRFVNLQGGRNNNLALDEFVELLNRDSKIVCNGYQTKESIIRHSNEFPLMVNFAKHLDIASDVRGRKGFHSVPSYKGDVQRILKDLQDIEALTLHPGRKLQCRKLSCDKDIYRNCELGLSSLIYRHQPLSPYCRLRNPTF